MPTGTQLGQRPWHIRALVSEPHGLLGSVLKQKDSGLVALRQGPRLCVFKGHLGCV